MTVKGQIARLGDAVEKRGTPELLEFEWRKTAEAFALGQTTSRFDVPRPVAFDASGGTLRLEFIPGFESLYGLVLRRAEGIEARFADAGRALAAIHGGFAKDGASRRTIPDAIAGAPADWCVLHGDFNGSNVGFDASRRRTVVLDWAPAPALEGTADIGSRYFDLTWFGLFFFRLRPLSRMWDWPADTLVESFLRAYAAVAGTAYDATALHRYSESIVPFLDADFALAARGRGQGMRARLFDRWQRRGWARWRKFTAAART